jgi:hypothetical protein
VQQWYPPPLKTPRTADYVQSYFIEGQTERRKRLVFLCIREFVRIFGKEEDAYGVLPHTNRWPHGVHYLDFEHVPRVYCSVEVPDDSLPPHLIRLKDYDKRFALGAGSRALDEWNRLIFLMNTSQDEILNIAWKMLQDDPKNGSKPWATNDMKWNHMSNHLYVNGTWITVHVDVQRRFSRNRTNALTKHNSMKEGSCVGIITIGENRPLAFKRKYQKQVEGCKEQLLETRVEKTPCEIFIQEHGSITIQVPVDEQMKERRKVSGNRTGKGSNFVGCFTHEVPPLRFPSVYGVSGAIILRNVVTDSIVDVRTSCVVPPEPTTDVERARKLRALKQKAYDEQPDSEGSLTAAAIREHWRNCFIYEGWMP